MAEQGPLTLFLGKACKVVFSDGGIAKTAVGTMVKFDEQSVVIERREGDNKKITVYVNRANISHIKMEEAM